MPRPVEDNVVMLPKPTADLKSPDEFKSTRPVVQEESEVVATENAQSVKPADAVTMGPAKTSTTVPIAKQPVDMTPNELLIYEADKARAANKAADTKIAEAVMKKLNGPTSLSNLEKLENNKPAPKNGDANVGVKKTVIEEATKVIDMPLKLEIPMFREVPLYEKLSDQIISLAELILESHGEKLAPSVKMFALISGASTRTSLTVLKCVKAATSNLGAEEQ